MRIYSRWDTAYVCTLGGESVKATEYELLDDIIYLKFKDDVVASASAGTLFIRKHAVASKNTENESQEVDK